MKQTRTWLIILTAIALVSGVLAPEAWAKKLDASAIFIEINDTDGDAGIQIFLDGEGWDTMQILDPAGRVVLAIGADNNVGSQGVTELFLESAEPSFDEQPLDEFLALFPEGRYRFVGRTTDGVLLTNTARLTHDIPDAPEITSPDEDIAVDPNDTVIEWEPVPNPPGSRIVGYRVIIATEEPKLREMEVDMGFRQTSLTVPPAFMRPGREYKVEVIAIEKSGNSTISELEFETQ